MGWSDEEIVLFIREYGSKKWVMYSLMALLGALLLLNYWMWRRLQRTRKQNEVHVDWTDAEDEVEVRLSLPAVVTASDIRVEVQHSYLKIFMKMGSTGKWEAKPLMEVEHAMPAAAPPHRPTAPPQLVPPPSVPADHPACSQGKLFKLIKSSETTWYVGEAARLELHGRAESARRPIGAASSDVSRPLAQPHSCGVAEGRSLKIQLQKQQEKHWKQLWEDTSELVKKDN